MTGDRTQRATDRVTPGGAVRGPVTPSDTAHTTRSPVCGHWVWGRSGVSVGLSAVGQWRAGDSSRRVAYRGRVRIEHEIGVSWHLGTGGAAPTAESDRKRPKAAEATLRSTKSKMRGVVPRGDPTGATQPTSLVCARRGGSGGWGISERGLQQTTHVHTCQAHPSNASHRTHLLITRMPATLRTLKNKACPHSNGHALERTPSCMNGGDTKIHCTTERPAA